MLFSIEGCLINYNRLKEKCKINYEHFGEDFLKGILMFLSNSKELHSLFRTNILETDGKKMHIIKPIILPIIFIIRDSLDNEAFPFEKDNFLLVLK